MTRKYQGQLTPEDTDLEEIEALAVKITEAWTTMPHASYINFLARLRIKGHTERNLYAAQVVAQVSLREGV